MKHFLDLTVLKRNRSYGRVYAGQFISLLGTMMTMVALPFQIYAATHSTVMVGLLSLVQLLPLLLTALIGGVIADQRERKRLLIGSECILVISCMLLIWNALQLKPFIWLIFLLAGLMSSVSGFHQPAFQGLLQQLVHPEDYKAVAALRTFAYSFCAIVGPAVAGVMIAKGGIAVTYGVDGFTFLVSIGILFTLKRLPKLAVVQNDAILAALKEGLLFAWRREALLGSYCVDIIAMIFAMPNALFPAIAVRFGGAETLGLLYAAPAVGSLVIALWSGWTSHIKRDGRAIAIAAALWGMTMIGLGVSHSLVLALGCLALSGAFDACSGIFRMNLWNRTIPSTFRGRLAGLEMLSYLGGPKIGDARAGMMAALIGIGPAMISGGVLCLVGIGACCYWLPEFWLASESQSASEE